MDKEIMNKILRRTREISGIPPGNLRPDAMEPISVDAMEPISVDALPVEPISVDNQPVEPISVDNQSPGNRPNMMEPISDDDEWGKPSEARTTINIGPITINANNQEEGQAAARAFKEEMARRGVQFSR